MSDSPEQGAFLGKARKIAAGVNPDLREELIRAHVGDESNSGKSIAELVKKFESYFPGTDADLRKVIITHLLGSALSEDEVKRRQKIGGKWVQRFFGKEGRRLSIIAKGNEPLSEEAEDIIEEAYRIQYFLDPQKPPDYKAIIKKVRETSGEKIRRETLTQRWYTLKKRRGK